MDIQDASSVLKIEHIGKSELAMQFGRTKALANEANIPSLCVPTQGLLIHPKQPSSLPERQAHAAFESAFGALGIGIVVMTVLYCARIKVPAQLVAGAKGK
jgi:hypothetical protein